MILPPEEPHFGPWSVISVQEFAELLQATLPKDRAGLGIIAVDGRSANGKSTLAALVSREVPGSVVVHTDDVPSSAAWSGRHRYSPPESAVPSFYDWSERVRENVLKPARAGKAVAYRPPSWTDWLREEGACIDAPPNCPLLIFEGVGAVRRELIDVIDVVVWVQADTEKAETRGIVRDGGDAEATTFWKKWMAEEFPFLAEQRPWDRANFIVSGTPDLGHDPDSEIVVAQKPPRSSTNAITSS